MKKEIKRICECCNHPIDRPIARQKYCLNCSVHLRAYQREIIGLRAKVKRLSVTIFKYENHL